MSEMLPTNQLCERALGALAKALGPAGAMRFLSILRNEPRDYQKWRDEHFKDLTVEALAERLQAAEHPRGD